MNKPTEQPTLEQLLQDEMADNLDEELERELGNDKRRARLNCIHHLLQQVPYQDVPHAPIDLPQREHRQDYARVPVPHDLYVPSIY